jgi:ribosome-associated heat shock protein Hsp15
LEANLMDKIRIDKWLWAARFYKTRSLATHEVALGHVQMDQHDVKPSREIKVGDVLTVVQAQVPRTVVVQALSDQRGPATAAQLLYEETPHSVALRTLEAERKRLSPEPAAAIEHGRPTKRDRRELQKHNAY